MQVARGYYMGLMTGVVQAIDPAQQHPEGASDSELATATSSVVAYSRADRTTLGPVSATSVGSWLSTVANNVLKELVNAFAIRFGPGPP